MHLILILFSFLCQWALAVPEANFEELMAGEVAEHFSRFTPEEFKNSQGLKIHFRSYLAGRSRPTLVILPGRSESILKYSELLYDLKDLNFNIFLIDHQGQGQSQRLLSDSEKGHVRFFEDYVRDLSGWVNQIVLPRSDSDEIYLLAHSMGGAIGVKLAAKKDLFKKIILSAPMLEMNTHPYSETIARIYSVWLVAIRKGNHYAPGKGPYVFEDDTFETNEVTHSRKRFDHNQDLKREFPEIILGGPTSRWVKESLLATKKIHQLGKKMKAPVLLLQAGADSVVKPERQDSFCQKASDCTLVRFPASFHEILMEEDSIRDEAIQRIRTFLGRHDED